MSPSWFERAQARIPGGVNSPVRAFGSVGGDPFFVARAHGAFLVDTDDREYIDYVQSWGASILGHAHPAIVEAVQKAAADGTSFGAPTAREVELAEAICDRVASVEKVRLVSSGTEAAMTAVRLARGVTGRAKIVKFAGCYHGHADALLAQAGSGVATLGLPGSAGVTPGTVADTIVVPYNDPPALDAALAEHGSDVAAVLVEPIAANMGLVPPAAGFLADVRERCTLLGALLVFDEVITGFRVGPGGAQQRFRITPDLSIFGKVVGGGLPLAAVGGSAAVMDHLAPLGAVYQAGTLSGNPLATAAGLAALAHLDDGAYAELERIAARLADGLRAAFAEAGVAAQVTQAFTLVGLFFSSTPITNYEQAQQADHKRYASFFHGLLDRGVYFAPSGYETLFPSLAHTDADIDRTIEAAVEAASGANSPTLLETIRSQGAGFTALGCPFYGALGEELALDVAHDGAVARVLAPYAEAPFQDAYVLRLFGAVHRMVLRGDAPAAAADFPSMGGDGDARAAMAAMRDLLAEPPASVLDAMTRPPQTNEVGRSVALASGMLVLASELQLPLRLREMGSSAALNSRVDSYWFEQDGAGWGRAESPVRFVDLWGGGAPPFSAGMEILDRKGCDRDPIDATDPEGAFTLLSYVWPEPPERFTRARDAIAMAAEVPVTIDHADVISWLPAQLREPHPGAALVIFHSVFWQYLDPETQESLCNDLDAAGAAATPDAPLAWLRLEPHATNYVPAELRLTVWDGHEKEGHERLLGTTGFHGGPINWLELE